MFGYSLYNNSTDIVPRYPSWIHWNSTTRNRRSHIIPDRTVGGANYIDLPAFHSCICEDPVPNPNQGLVRPNKTTSKQERRSKEKKKPSLHGYWWCRNTYTRIRPTSGSQQENTWRGTMSMEQTSEISTNTSNTHLTKVIRYTITKRLKWSMVTRAE